MGRTVDFRAGGKSLGMVLAPGRRSLPFDGTPDAVKAQRTAAEYVIPVDSHTLRSELRNQKAQGGSGMHSLVQVLRTPVPGDSSLYFRQGEMRADRAKGDAEGGQWESFVTGHMEARSTSLGQRHSASGEQKTIQK